MPATTSRLSSALDLARNSVLQAERALVLFDERTRAMALELQTTWKRVHEMEANARREAGWEKPLQEARKAHATLDASYDARKAARKPLEAALQAATEAVDHEERLLALDGYNHCAAGRPELWDRLTQAVDALTGPVRDYLALTEKQATHAEQLAWQFPPEGRHPLRLLAEVLYGTMARLLPPPPNLAAIHLPVRPYVAMDGAAEPASEKHMPPAPNFVKVVAVNRQRGMGLCPPEWQITQQELHELDLGKPVNIPRDRWEPISQHHLYAEFLTSAPVEIWQ